MKTLQTELIEKGYLQARTSEVDEKSTKATDKPKEQLSQWELEELMGTRRDTFKRHRGSVRKR